MLDVGMSRDALTAAIYDTIRGNEMTDGVHIRLMVTRGVKSTPYQDPRMTIGPATVVIIAEHKEPMPSTVTDGITLFTTHVRRATPGHPRPQAQRALQAQRHPGVHPGLHRRRRRGADARPARVRRDLQQHPLLLRRRARRTGPRCGRPTAGSASAGITRGNVLRVCRDAGITARETTFSLTDVYSASEAFVTGTFAGVVPVHSVDGRTIGTGARGPVVERLQGLYGDLVAADVRRS